MKFGRKRKLDKLYKQWVNHGDLPSGAIPQEESPKGVPIGRERNGREKRGRERSGRERSGEGLDALYILLAIIGIGILCAGLYLLFTHGS